jgi:catechol 2,3-dioxygenase-like lactoylglutathione lyase family enzyme
MQGFDMAIVKDIAFVRYQVEDLDRMEAFLLDFGLSRSARTDKALYMRAAGPRQHVHISELGPQNKTLGFGLIAQSAQDLEQLAPRVGSRVEANPEPGGGQRVRFVDPAGFLVDLIHGQAMHAALETRAPTGFNPASGRTRFGRTIRLKAQPSAVMRLGHIALLVADFPKTYAFYQELLGLRASDTYWAGVPDNTIAAFMHCGLGETWTDHHTLAMIAAPDGVSRFDHSAFEVLDLDDVAQGGAHLLAQGYQHSWGIGRHIQGSQIFDYWRDPFGNKIEHWTDGDLVNDDTPAGSAPMAPGELAQWGPPLLPEFFD